MNIVLRRGDLELWKKTSAKSTYRFLMLDQEKISFRNRYPRYVTYFIVATYRDRVIKVFEESLQEENDTKRYRTIKNKFQEIIAL